MSVSEFERHQIFQWYEEAMGSDKASIMMRLLPPVGWGDIATRGDLMALSSELRGEIAQLRGEVCGEIGGVRGEIAEVRGEVGGVRGEIAEVRGEIGGVRGDVTELRGEMHLGFAKLLRSMYFAVVASNATIAGIVLAAVQLA